MCAWVSEGASGLGGWVDGLGKLGRWRGRMGDGMGRVKWTCLGRKWQDVGSWNWSGVFFDEVLLR